MTRQDSPLFLLTSSSIFELFHKTLFLLLRNVVTSISGNSYYLYINFKHDINPNKQILYKNFCNYFLWLETQENFSKPDNDELTRENNFQR